MNSQHKKSRIGVGPRRWQARRLRKWQEVSHVSVHQIELLTDSVPSQLFVDLKKTSGFEALVVSVESSFTGLQELWNVCWKLEVQLPALPNAFQRPKEESPVLYDRSSSVRAGIPAQ